MLQIVQKETQQGHRGLAGQSLPTHRRRLIRALIVDDDLTDVDMDAIRAEMARNAAQYRQ